MNQATVEWKFELNTVIPLIRIRGTTDNSAPIVESLLMTKALELIESAKRYNGCPFRHDIPTTQNPLMISFTLIFKDHKSVQNYINTLQ